MPTSTFSGGPRILDSHAAPRRRHVRLGDGLDRDTDTIPGCEPVECREEQRKQQRMDAFEAALEIRVAIFVSERLEVDVNAPCPLVLEVERKSLEERSPANGLRRLLRAVEDRSEQREQRRSAAGQSIDAHRSGRQLAHALVFTDQMGLQSDPRQMVADFVPNGASEFTAFGSRDRID